MFQLISPTSSVTISTFDEGLVQAPKVFDQVVNTLIIVWKKMQSKFVRLGNILLFFLRYRASHRSLI